MYMRDGGSGHLGRPAGIDIDLDRWIQIDRGLTLNPRLIDRYMCIFIIFFIGLTLTPNPNPIYIYIYIYTYIHTYTYIYTYIHRD